MNFRLILGALVLAIASLGVVGCSTPISNLIPRKVPANASGIYEFSFRARLTTPGILSDSVQTYLVINGEEVLMRENPSTPRLFETEYRIPEGQNEARYYYVVRYQFERDGYVRKGEVFSEYYILQLVNRYVLQLLTDRGPVGSEVAVVGSGFSTLDTVLFGGVEIPTRVANANALSFTVPAVPGGSTYPLTLRTGTGDIDIGLFRVDSASISAVPASLSLTVGERTMFIVTIPFEAPAGGVRVDVQTDVPASVIMPEIVIPAGSRSVSVPVEGGASGSGALYVAAPGFGEVVVPVTVR